MNAETVVDAPNIAVVDTHCHASEVWQEPIEMLLYQMDRWGVAQATIVQLAGHYDNGYLMECVRRFPDRFVGVVLLDARRADACEELERLADEGASGLRLRAGDRSPGSDPLLIWRTAERLRLPVTIFGSVADRLSAEFAALVAEFPELPIVLEHLGGHGYKQNQGGDASAEEERLKYEQGFALSRFPNVYMKVHGVGEIAARPRAFGPTLEYVEPIPSYHLMAYEAFGASRLMWGSDHPPVSSREGYGNALSSCRQRFEGLSIDDQRQILGGTARKLYFGEASSN